MIDGQSVGITVIAVALLVLVYFAGWDLGRRNLVINIDTYGCEKVIAAYHGTERK